MSGRALEEAVERAERALLRIERQVQLAAGRTDGNSDQHLRSRVAAALADLDKIIAEVEHGGG